MKWMWGMVLLGAGAAMAQPWETPDVLEINREPMRAYAHQYADAEQAAQFELKNSLHQSLNGVWQFKWARTPAESPADFYQDGVDLSGWDTLTVPSNWQMALDRDYDRPIYVNAGYSDFDDDVFPAVMTEPYGNPTAAYKRTFTVNEAWANGQVFVHFDGVESAFQLWVNGRFVGYGQDSKLPSEFNLTPYLRDGENTMALRVFRWSDGSWLEDQDGFNLSGIYRDVWLYPTPTVAIRDFHAWANLDAEYRDAEFSVDVMVRNYGTQPSNPRQLQVGIAGQQLTASVPVLPPGTEKIITLKTAVANPGKWTAETPNLYPLILTLSQHGKPTQVTGTEFGFRKLEIEGNVLKLNGKAFVQKGVNRVEHDPVHGHDISRDRMEQELRLMKQHNINAVRTAHFPASSEFYVLCNRYGIYVMDEANLESTGHGIVDHPEWKPAHEARMERMIRRDWNHPCVVVWSVGNEAGVGPNMEAMHDLARRIDPSRPTSYHYQSKSAPYDLIAGGTRKGGKGRYYNLHEWEALGQAGLPKPYIRTEGEHAMGNAMGDLKAVVDVMEKYPSLGGFYIWDWVDQAIQTRTPAGQIYMGYGGDFGEKTHSYNFCLNGIVMADLRPTGKLAEVGYCYQNADFFWADPGRTKIRLKNKNFYVGLNRFSGHWCLLKNGVTVREGVLHLPDVEPRSSGVFASPVDPSSLDAGDEWMLNVSLQTTEDQPWAARGFAVASEQLALSEYAFPKPMPEGGTRLKIVSGKTTTTIKGSHFSVELNQETGLLENYVVDGKLCFKRGPKLNFWRAPLDNDAGNRLKRVKAKLASTWLRAGLDRLQHNVVSLKQDHGVIHVKHEISTEQGGFHADTTIRISDDGALDFSYHIIPFGQAVTGLETLPRVGTELILPEGEDTMEWYGRGPFHNYADRKLGTPLAWYSRTVDEMFVNYPYPQENGNRSDTRWAAMADSAHAGLKVRGFQPLEVSAHHYTLENLTAATHTWELQRVPEIYWTIDWRQCGVGNGSCGGVNPRPGQNVPPKPVDFGFRLEPVVPVESQAR